MVLIVRFDEYKGAVSHCLHRALSVADVFLRFIDRFEKPVVVYRFEQKVDRIEIEALYCIVAMAVVNREVAQGAI
jgi:hypothetical protein